MCFLHTLHFTDKRDIILLYNQCILVSKGRAWILETFIRKPSSNECMYMDLNDIGYNTAIRFFLEISAMPDIEKLNDIFAKAVHVFRGINLKYRKNCWYISDAVPPVGVITETAENIESVAVTPFDYRVNTVRFNVVIPKNKKIYLCFDFFHGAADGVTALSFLHCFFDILNGCTPALTDPTLSDVDIVSHTHNSKHSPILFPNSRLIGEKTSNIENVGDITLSIVTSSTVFSVASLITEAVCAEFDRPTVMIPVDIRRYYKKDGFFLCGNLALPLFLRLDKGQNSLQIANIIKEKVENRTPLSRRTADFCGYRRILPFLRRQILRLYTGVLNKSKRYALSGLVSSVGMLDKTRLQNTYFSVLDAAVTLSPIPNAAFTAVALRFGDKVHITVSGNGSKMGKDKLVNTVGNIRRTLYHYIEE